MSRVRSVLVSVAVAGMVMSGEALAQAPEQSAPAKEPSTTAKIEAKADEVAKWTTKEWNKAKAKWAKEKEKWAGCQKQSKDQGLTGRKSWSFLASCMTSAT
jgi:Rieske Fe-S protein